MEKVLNHSEDSKGPSVRSGGHPVYCTCASPAGPAHCSICNLTLLADEIASRFGFRAVV